MALNFPDNPSVNDIYRDSTSGFAYQWDGTVWQSYSDSSLGEIKILDDISGSFNGSTQTFALTSNTSAVVPANAQQVRVVLGGVVQDPADDYSVSSSNITFTTPPTGGLSFSGIVFGNAVPINTILDGTVTPSKLSTGGPSWNTNGDVNIAGIVTATNLVLSNDLLVSGGGNFSGIVTATNFVSTSDENLKENIQTINNALERLSEIRGVSFDWKKDRTSSMGVIAQEVEKVLPSLVMTSEFKSVNYDGIIGVLIEAVKELQQRVEDLEKNDT